MRSADAEGHELAKIQERVAGVEDSMEVEDPEGNRLAMVKKALVSPGRDRWSVQIGDGPDLVVRGARGRRARDLARRLSGPSAFLGL